VLGKGQFASAKASQSALVC